VRKMKELGMEERAPVRRPILILELGCEAPGVEPEDGGTSTGYIWRAECIRCLAGSRSCTVVAS
jgi:hypothetical protein